MLLFSLSALAAGGPDAHGYTWHLLTHDFVELQGTSAPMPLLDDGEWDITLPRPFTFYGVDYTEITVSANGALTFEEGAVVGYQNAGFPRTAPPDPDVAVFWDDLDPWTEGGVWFADLGDRAVISWEDVRHVQGAGTVSVQVHLVDDGSLEMHYADTDGGWGFEDGASATVGIQDKTGGTALSGGWLVYSHDLDVVLPGTALRFAVGGTGCEDLDGDGHPSELCGGFDCDDQDAAVHPGAFESCDDFDQDCDGDLLEHFDQDGDGVLDCQQDDPDDAEVEDDPEVDTGTEFGDETVALGRPAAPEVEHDPSHVSACGCQVAEPRVAGLFALLAVLVLRRRR